MYRYDANGAMYTVSRSEKSKVPNFNKTELEYINSRIDTCIPTPAAHLITV